MTYQFHHLGIPTDEIRPGEKYSPTFKMYTSGGEDPNYRVQYHRIEKDSCLHPLLQKLPHIAFKVDSIDEAIKGKPLLLEPYSPFEGFRVAIVEIGGAPVEFIETTLSEEEIWSDAPRKSVLYPDEG